MLIIMYDNGTQTPVFINDEEAPLHELYERGEIGGAVLCPQCETMLSDSAFCANCNHQWPAC